MWILYIYSIVIKEPTTTVLTLWYNLSCEAWQHTDYIVDKL